MQDNKEEQIIQLALAKGLVSEQDLEMVDQQERKNENITTRKLEGLIEAGLLSKAMWRALEEEVEARRKSPAFQLPFTIGQDLLAFASSQSFKKESEPNDKESLSKTMKSNTTISRELKLNTGELIKAGRYDLIKLLGEGGMGSVFLAYDPDLQRYVALKFLHSGDKEATQRLIQEGRAQAKIEHPNVCRVYEVGKFNGRIYIAMQYVDGLILPKITKRLSLEQKVKIMADVAEGLNAAHKLGLIHRDVKPQNVIVEKTDDGDWKPYIMDFGLVREVSQKGMTMTGEILGTPYYMSPEQARGKTELLDRRSDVYSLGATLYELLSGKPPQEGTDVVDLLKQIATEDVTPLRKIVPQIPLDLETIVMKSLEKDLSRRYDSANALAQDLRRFLSGEPIEAKQVSLTYFFYRLAVKHKVIVISSSLALIILLITSINVYRVKMQAENQRRLSQELGGQVEEIEHMMRHSHMLPLHNINQEMGLIDSQVKELRVKIETLKDEHNIIGLYALGRVYQEIGNYEQAQSFLEQAWQEGYQDPKVAYALGVVSNKVYERKLEEIERHVDREIRELERQRLQADLGKKAAQYLTIGKQLETNSEYADALIAFYEGKFDLTLVKADQAMKKIPWLYEASRLIGDAHVKIAETKKSFADKEKEYDLAEKAYQDAIKIAPSDPETYSRLVELRSRILIYKYGQGLDIELESAALLKAANLSLQTNPYLTDNYVRKADAYLYLGLYKARRLRENPSIEYQYAVSEIQNGIRNSTVVPKFYDKMGLIFKLKGEYLLDIGKDPSQDFENSISTYNKALEVNKDYLPSYVNISVVCCMEALYQIKQGQDPTQKLQKAATYCKQAIAANPNIYNFYNKLLYAYVIETQYLMGKGQDPSIVLEKALVTFNKAIELNPNNFISYNYLGTIYLNIADYLVQAGKDPQDVSQKALENFGHDLSSPTIAPANYSNIAGVYVTKALYRLSVGDLSKELLDQVIYHCDKALTYNDKFTLAYILKSFSYKLQAIYLVKQKGTAEELLEKAMSFGEKAYQNNNGDMVVCANLAEIFFIYGQQKMNRKQEPTKELTQALYWLEKAKTLAPGNNFFYVLEGKIYLLEAENLILQQKSPENSLEKSQEALQRAIAINPNNSQTYAALANTYRWQIEWYLKQNKPVDKPFEEGLMFVEKAVSNNSDDAEAYSVQGAIYLLSAKGNQHSSAKKEFLEKSQKAFDKAFSLNKLLINEYKEFLEKNKN